MIVFDEAQRAYDQAQVAIKHPDMPAKSEPALMIDFADRVPEWSVVIGLIGSGQEIHIGEEGGVGQWRSAVESSIDPRRWTIHCPETLGDVFDGSSVPVDIHPELDLKVELRFHLADRLHEFVAGLLEVAPAASLRSTGGYLATKGFHLRMTRNLDTAKQYLRDRYADDSDARFGMVASSRDKTLCEFGVPNGFQDTKNVRLGPWYGEPEGDVLARSCRQLAKCVTEFGAQGLELDAALVAWGTDFVLKSGAWTNEHARKYSSPDSIKDPLQLRKNAYRVLLTRGRDGSVMFIPKVKALDETFAYFQSIGIREL